MKRLLSILIVLTGLAVIVAQGTIRGQAPAPRPAPPIDSGPGDQGATLKQPWMDAPVKSGPPTGSGFQNLWNPVVNSGLPNRGDPSNPFAAKVALPPSNPTDGNRDIELTKEHGNWVIFLISYSGEKAPQMARKCVIEMRTNPKYKLNTFVFNYGAEEKRKEFERVQKAKEEQRLNKARLQQTLAEQGIYGEIAMPVRVQAVRIDEQTGVLIAGGFKTREAAAEAMKAIRKLPDPDPTKVDMDIVTVYEDRSAPKPGYMSPFKKAFVARNPCLPKETQTVEEQKIDMELLRKLNAGEPYCLLNRKEHFTLVVKQFNTQSAVKTPDQFNGFMNTLFKKEDSVDYAAKNAASLAEMLRRGGCETYVLHTKYSSFVTAGAYENLNDPLMAGMQTSLQQFFRNLTTGTDPRLAQVIQSLDLPTQYQPMLIPH
jgi:hypothetical protein